MIATNENYPWLFVAQIFRSS